MINANDFKTFAEAISPDEVERVGTLLIRRILPNCNSAKAGAAALAAIYQILLERMPEYKRR